MIYYNGINIFEYLSIMEMLIDTNKLTFYRHEHLLKMRRGFLNCKKSVRDLLNLQKILTKAIF